MEAVRGPFHFLWYEGCMIQEWYCCAVAIGQQPQVLDYLLRAVGTPSLEEKTKGLWFLVSNIKFVYSFWNFTQLQVKSLKSMYIQILEPQSMIILELLFDWMLRC